MIRQFICQLADGEALKPYFLYDFECLELSCPFHLTLKSSIIYDLSVVKKLNAYCYLTCQNLRF